jgi:hypothetical protein
MKLKSFYNPTPKKWRRLGDALLGVSTTITSFSIYNDMKEIAIAALLLGVVGKFLSNFFTEDPQEPIA